MMDFKRTTFALGALLITASVWFAQTSGALTPTQFEQMDNNQDGQLGQEEFIDGMHKIAHDQVDANNDGAIDLEEWSRYDKSPQNVEHFNKFDQDQSGNLSLIEFKGMKPQILNMSQMNGDPSDPKRLFVTMDRNNDQMVSRGEYGATRSSQAPVVRLLSFNF